MLLFPATLRMTFRLLFCAGGWSALSLAAATVDATRLEAARALYLERGKSAEAQKAFEAIAAEDPKNASAQLHLGLLALRRDDAEKAKPYVEQALQLAPNDAEMHRVMGDIYGRQAQKASIFSQPGLAKKCLAEYERAVALDPRNIDAHASLFEFYRRAPGIMGGGEDKALATAATIKRLDPTRGRIAFATFYVEDKKYDQAFAQFEEVLRTTPEDYAALYQIGRIAAVSGQQLDRGLASLRRCLALPVPAGLNTPGHAAAQWRIGNILEKKGDTAGARAAYNAALKLDPNFTAATEALKKLK
ncbi:MAG TPA: tetratricopeptide repeat protein [Opitutaceae bacterium]|nr:tetratricopeptide repeat protein [Opitutaceae bacterium]